jgi:hypothetical protein
MSLAFLESLIDDAPSLLGYASTALKLVALVYPPVAVAEIGVGVAEEVALAASKILGPYLASLNTAEGPSVALHSAASVIASDNVLPQGWNAVSEEPWASGM